MHTTGTPSSRRPRQIAGDMRPVSITARSIGPYRSSIMAIASGELSTFSDTTFRPLSSTMQTCVDSIDRSEEHTSELQSLMRNSYAVFCLKKKKYTVYV